MMTNAALQKMIEDYGNRLFCINLDNGRFMYIDYTDGIPLTDISFETVVDVDMIVVKRKHKKGDTVVNYTTRHVTSTVQWVGIMDADSADLRVDPIILR